MVFQSTYAKVTTNQSHTNSPKYPKNEHGQTYGSAEVKCNVQSMRLFTTQAVEGQVQDPNESHYFSGFFVLSVQILVPNRGQELVPIATVLP